MKFVLVDTSVLCELLRVPGRHDPGRARALGDELRARQKTDRLYLSPAVVVETGNHIARAADGALRRAAAKPLRDLVTDAVDGRAPFTWVTSPNEASDWRRLLDRFVDLATAGISLGDSALILEVESLRRRAPNAIVSIWTLDAALGAHGDP